MNFIYYKPNGQINFGTATDEIHYLRLKKGYEANGFKVEIEEKELGKQIERIKNESH